MTGSGTLADPYVIWDVNDLQNVNLDLTAYYELGADINATVTAGWNGGLGFIPIGSWTAPLLVGFSGHFDGKGRTITNLSINRRKLSPPIAPGYTMWCVGLFYCIDNNGIVQSVSLTNPSVTGHSKVGAIAGCVGCVGTVDGIPMGTGVGFITNCTVSGGVVQTEPGSNWGCVGGACGHVGQNFPLVVPSILTNVNSENTTVIAHRTLGGLAGQSEGTIQNSHSTGCTLSDTGAWATIEMGGLVGFNYGLIDTCYSNNLVVSLPKCLIGGLVGQNTGLHGAPGNGTIRNSYATGNVAGGGSIGGLIGLLQDGTIESSYATGSVTASAGMAGGLIGSSMSASVTLSVTDSHATGNVTSGDDYAGGFIGYISSPNVGFSAAFQRCYATGSVFAAAGRGYIGGFVGESDKRITISQCFASGNVSTAGGDDDWIGGFMGCNWGTSVNDCYARGSVTGNNRVGGFVGYNRSGVIDKCYSTGLVTGVTMPGGFSSTDPAQGGTISDSYWDTQASSMVVSGGGTGKTTAEMKDELTFLGWAFTTIWGLTPLCNDAYPCLLGVTPLCAYGLPLPPFPLNKAYAMSRNGVVR